MAKSSPTVLHVTTTDMSLELLLGPQLRAFSAAGFDVQLASAPGPHADRLVAEGFSHHGLRHATRGTALHRDALALGELYQLFRSIRPEIVHTHNPKPGVYGRVAGWATRCPAVVNTQHGLYAQPTDALRRRAPVYALERIAAACSDMELVQSEEDMETLRRLRVPEDRLRLLGNGIDLERFRFRPAARARLRAELGVDESTAVVATAGRLVREKGIGEFIEAAVTVLGDNPAAMFVIVGPEDSTKGDAIPAADIAAAHDNGVRVLGMRDDLDDLYSAFDVFVLASYREGFPRTVMEAAACNLPVVATDIRGCRQAVRDGQTGVLVPPRTSRPLGTAIRRLVEDGELRKRMATQARILAEAEFDQQRVIDRTLDVYRTLLQTDVSEARARPRRRSMRYRRNER